MASKVEASNEGCGGAPPLEASSSLSMGNAEREMRVEDKKLVWKAAAVIVCTHAKIA
jgi:hypothetical protein